MKNLGPLRFGLPPAVQVVYPVQATTALQVVDPVQATTAVKAAIVTGTFSLIISGVTGTTFGQISIAGPTGATASINWGNGTPAVTLTKTTAVVPTVNNNKCGATVTITGSNSLTSLTVCASAPGITGTAQILGVTGSFPGGLTALNIGFNRAGTTFSAPNIPNLNFMGSTGPTSLTLGSTVSGLTGLPPNLVTLNASGCTGGLRTLLTLPKTLTSLYPPLTGLTGLDLTGTNISVINITPTAMTQLSYLKTTGSKMTLTGLLDYPIAAKASWTIY